MDIFGIGPTELAFIILIALILLGPKEMEKTGRTIGRFLRDFTQSSGWQAFRQTSREIRSLPNRLMREANFEDLQKDINKIGKDIEESADLKGYGTWSTPATTKPKPPQSRPVSAEAKKSPDTAPEPVPPAAPKADKDTPQDA